MKYPEAMIDCETLSTQSNAALLSIGVQLFDFKKAKLGPTYYHEIDLESSIKSGGHVSGSTISWWMRQGESARKLFKEDRERLPLATALHTLTTWLREHAEFRVQPWSNGAAADIVWIENAHKYGCVGLSVPWDFRNVRDYRTLVWLAEQKGFDRKSVPSVGVAHNALDDAIYQTHVAKAAWDVLVAGKKQEVVLADDEI